MRVTCLSLILTTTLALTLSQRDRDQYRNQYRNLDLNRNWQNQRIQSILDEVHTELEEKIRQGVTISEQFGEFFEITGLLNKYRQTLNRLATQLNSVRTPRDLYAQLNINEIQRNVKQLDIILGPAYAKVQNVQSGSNLNFLSNIWNDHLDLLSEFKDRGANEETWVPLNWTVPLKKFIHFLEEESYVSAVNFNEEITNMTRDIGSDFLAEIQKLDLTIPRRSIYGKGNITAELLNEKEEELHDLRLRGVQDVLVGKLNSLAKFQDDLAKERTVSKFVQKILRYKDEYSISRSSLYKLQKIVQNSKDASIDLDFDDKFGRMTSPLNKDEWVRGFDKIVRFADSKIGDIKQREKDRENWKSSEEYHKILVARSKQDIVGAYAIVCKTKCAKDKDYFYCTSITGKWDYCSPNEGQDYKGKTCLDSCSYKGANYKWCKVAGDSWGYCSTY